MISADTNVVRVINSPVRRIRAGVELYDGSTLLRTFKHNDLLKSFTVERVGEESKFFGFGICQKINVKVLDVNRAIELITDYTLKVVFNDAVNPYPLFKISEVHRDENTNQLSITAYDALYQAASHTVEELQLAESYSIEDFARACAAVLGLSLNVTTDGFDTVYPTGANFNGSENIREALDAVAEATQTIYYVNNQSQLVFKRLDMSGEAVASITKSHYITLTSGANRRLATIMHATELGDNVSATMAYTGSTQYVRNNPFWDLREDIGQLVDAAIDRVGGLTINQFDCKWIGNYLLEMGDKISLTTKDDEVVMAYVLDDIVTYTGGLSEVTKWKYTDNSNETAANPANLGDALKKTYARVDKVNNEITLIANETNNNTNNISSLLLNTESISASVQNIEKATTESLGEINESLAELSKSVDATITAEDIQIAVQTELSNGVNAVTTTTGFTFNGDGLTVKKSNSEMSTQITEDGMTVSRDNEVVLTANNVGVDAINLHATTYLIVGNNSRFEDYDDRTGCFYIGEVNG